MFRLFHYEGSVVDRAREFQATFAIAQGYAYGRDRMFEVEHHVIFTRYHRSGAEKDSVYPKAGVRLVL